MNDEPDSPRSFDLRARYGDETQVERYRRLTVGPGASNLDLLWHELLLGLLTGLPGAAGLWLRGKLYPPSFPGISRGAHLGRHVTLRCPRHVELGAGVLIDDFVQLVATSEAQPAISIGADSFVRSFAMLNAGPPEGWIRIGRGSSVGQATIIYGNGGVSIGDAVMIAGQCFIVASSHNTGDPATPMAEQGYSARGISIGDNVWIGAGAKILDGVSIGSGAIVGANAVVTADVAEGATVAGVPARALDRNPDR